MDTLVLSNFLHRPGRTAASVLGIAVGVMLIVFTVGLANGSLRGEADREANVGAEIFFRSSGAVGFGSADMLRIPIELKKQIEAVPGVAAAIPLAQNIVEAKDSKVGQRLVDGIDFDSYASSAGLSIVAGRALGTNGDEAIIDTGWQRQMKLKVGDPFKLYGRNFTIVGTYEPASGARIKIPLATMQKQLSGTGKVSAFLVKVAKGRSPEKVADTLHKLFPDYRMILTKNLEELYMSSVPALNVFLNVTIAVAAAVSALIILLTMYTAVTERTHQIGILKSLGMSRASIALTIAGESALVTGTGIVVGTALAFLLRLVLTPFIALEVEIDLPLLLLVAIVGVTGGILGSLYPAFRAARLDAVDALNYE